MENIERYEREGIQSPLNLNQTPAAALPKEFAPEKTTEKKEEEEEEALDTILTDGWYS